MAVETRLNSINFAGLDGFPYFRGQVTTDAAWRQHSVKYGYRVKVRIFGVHPPSDEVPDSELPWAPVIVSCNFGSGKAFAGTSLNLQGGETVIGFFADNDKQQPVIFGCYQSEAFHDNIIAYPENADGSTMFYEMEASSELVFGENNMPANHEDPKKLNGIPDRNNHLPNGKTTKQRIIDEENLIVRKAQKCKGGSGFGNDIRRALASFVEVAGKFESYQDAYIDPVMDEMRDIQKLVGETAQVISDSYSQVIRLSRSFLFAKIAELSEDMMGFMQLDSLLKDISVKKAKDSIYCLLENVIKSLKNTIKNFLTGLLGKLVQAPLCAAEQFLAGLNSRMFNEIEYAIGDAMSSLSGLLGPTIGNFMGFMDKAMGYAQIGLALLECEGQECDPEPYDWALNFGADKHQKLDFKKTIDISSKFNVAGIGKSVSDGIDKFFGLDDDDVENAEYVKDLLGSCPILNKECGPPKIEIFGGGGFGAAANAVINELGEIVGVNMQSLGVGYTEKPFVSIVDNCDGRGAEGEAILEDGKVINIIIRNGGGGYQVPDEVSDADGIDVVGEIEGVEIIRTGRDYESGDLITSDCGTLEPVLDGTGRIVGANVVHADLGCKVIPKLRIKSDTGYGALLRPIMRYKKVEDYDSTIPLDSNLIMKVVDCVSSY
tara:strand:- start:650 stop:2626 length:1977 start_codon:yes stop_codon:yes gene_type:complete